MLWFSEKYDKIVRKKIQFFYKASSYKILLLL